MKVIIGALAHESNSFCRGLTTRRHFTYHEGERVKQLLPVTDIFEAAGIEVVPGIYAAAESYAPVEEGTYWHFVNRLLEIVRTNPDADGVWMFCHGAMTVENVGSGEYRLACELRRLLPKGVIAFGMDLHGNLEEDLANQVNILRCYHTAPHTDQEDTYRRTAAVMVEYLQKGYRCKPQVRALPMVFPGEMAATTTKPLADIIPMLKRWEAQDEAIACASVYVGFAWCDAPRTHTSVVVVPAAPQHEAYCAQKAGELADLLFCRRREFDFEQLALPPDEAAEAAMQRLVPPVCVTDMGDNPTAGTNGDSTVLLAAFAPYASKESPVLVAGIYDAAAFALCSGAQAGSTLELTVGAGSHETDRPVTLKGWVEPVCDILGYTLPSQPPVPKARGVVLRCEGLDVVLVDRPFAFTQRASFESLSLPLAGYRAIVTKFGYIYPELKQLAISFIMANTPGESYQMIQQLPFKHIRRPIYPLDDISPLEDTP